jgi:single-strand DNA-binding protein
MASLNKVILLGNLSRDPEIRYAASGTAVIRFGLAVNTTTGTGEHRKEETCFVDCVAFGRTAETIGQYCAKGKQVLTDGRLVLQSWEDKKSGERRSKHEVVVDRIQFFGQKQEQAAQEGPGAGAQTNADPDDIPF